MKKALPLLLLGLLLATGCNYNERGFDKANERNGNSEPLLDKRQTTQENAGKASQANNITRINRVEITEQVREIIEERGDLMLASVMINGIDLWVIAHSNKRLTPRGIIRENAELKKKLDQTFPQFHVEVRVEES